MKKSIMCFFILLLSSCKSYDIPQANNMHPANPKAEASSEIKQTQILKIDQDNLPDIPEEMKDNMKRM